jgi:hypothetical protein
MDTNTIIDRLKALVEEWETFECSDNQETDEWCSATEDALWGCSEKLNDIIAEFEDEEII